MSNILAANGIFKSYGDISVLKDVSINVAPGTTHAVIGPNGAGKTTLFKVLSGELFSDQGKVEFLGKDVTRTPGFERVRLGMGRTFQVARVFTEATVLENMIIALESFARYEGKGPGLFSVAPSENLLSKAHATLASVDLLHRTSEHAGILAYGERKRLELALALALHPKMLLLDEPMAGMSPGDRIAAIQLLKKISKEHAMSILLTEHDMNVVFALADHVTVLNYGEVIATGTPEEVRGSAIVREVYLGQEHA